MRGNQQPVHSQEERNHRQQQPELVQFQGLEISKKLASVKTRSPTPVLANDGGGSFWLASVTAGAVADAILPAHEVHPVMDPSRGSAETGFINSQPSMAEFMTALPQLAGEGPLHSPNTGGSTSPIAHHTDYHTLIDSHGAGDASGVNVPEYPWMKEKKTTRKSSQQGKTKSWTALNQILHTCI